MSRTRVAAMLLALALPAAAGDPLPGGDTTIPRAGADFLQPLANLSLLRQEDHLIGRSLFRNPWVIPPSSTNARDGLGPVFNARTCVACHRGGGRGHPPREGESGLDSAILRLSVPGAGDFFGARPEPTYGIQLQTHGVGRGPNGALPAAGAGLDGRTAVGEGRVRVDYTAVAGHYADGTPYTLRRPTYRVGALSYGPLAPDTRLSLRVAQPLAGMGLLESIPAEDLIASADPGDDDGDGISGRVHWLPGPNPGDRVIGRFGHKATQPDVLHQTASALRGDLGITSRLYPRQPCGERQTACHRQPDGNGPQQPGVEIADRLLDAMAFYVRTLAVPNTAAPTPTIRRGRGLFDEANCVACHTPRQRTGARANFPELGGQTVVPYTDLLLHDMGSGLADDRPVFDASGREWRTPPLWGIGLTEELTGRATYLHDGRARTLAEAILWHGGEAEAARENFRRFDADQRAALIAFLRSL